MLYLIYKLLHLIILFLTFIIHLVNVTCLHVSIPYNYFLPLVIGLELISLLFDVL